MQPLLAIALLMSALAMVSCTNACMLLRPLSVFPMSTNHLGAKCKRHVNMHSQQQQQQHWQACKDVAMRDCAHNIGLHLMM